MATTYNIRYKNHATPQEQHTADGRFYLDSGVGRKMTGIADIVQDTTPQLGGALDGQNNNMSNIGTIDGSNLQLDFGTL